jgi:hypothetical protein
MPHITRDTLRRRLHLAEQDESSPVLGGDLRLRELTRAALKDAARWATTTDLAERERVRGLHLAAAVQAADGDPVQLRQALFAYELGAPETAIDSERWNAALLAASWIDLESGEPMVAREDVLAWPARPEITSEVARLASCVLDLAEVGRDHLKSSDPAPDPL